MSQLAGKHAVVTGGGSGIGLAIAKALAGERANVTIMGRNRERLETVAGRMVGCRAIACDVASAEAVTRAFRQAQANSGRIDILVNNAGIVETAPFLRMDEAAFRRMLDVNLMGAFHATQAVLPGMLEAGWGRIVNIASTAGLKGYPYVSGYTASKHALVGLTRSLALETAKKGITVNALCPGYTETDIVAGAVDKIAAKTGRDEAAARAEFEAVNPMGRLVQPDEVAASVVWLCQPSQGAITGQSIAIAGGEVM